LFPRGKEMANSLPRIVSKRNTLMLLESDREGERVRERERESERDRYRERGRENVSEREGE
jgi:hypothetical protein